MVDNDASGTPIKEMTKAQQYEYIPQQNPTPVATPNQYATPQGPMPLGVKQYDAPIGPQQPPKQSFRSKVSNAISNKVKTVENNINQATSKGVVQSAKEVGGTAWSYAKQGGKNAMENLKEDSGYLKNQGISTVKNAGLTEKQSIRKYGDVQYPTMFGGAGGYGDIITSDRGRQQNSKIKQVTSFSKKENDEHLKSRSMDIIGDNTKKDKKKKENKETKKKVIKQKPMDFNSIGMVGNPLVMLNASTSRNKKQTSLSSGFSIGSLSDYRDPLDGKVSKPKPLKGKRTNTNISNGLGGVMDINMFGNKNKKKGWSLF